MVKTSSKIERQKNKNVAKSARQAIKRGKKSNKKHKKNRTISFWWILSPVLVCIGISLVLAVVIRCRDTERGASVPKGSYDYAVDISKYQKDVNWDSLMVVTDAAGRTVENGTWTDSLENIGKSLRQRVTEEVHIISTGVQNLLKARLLISSVP